MTDIPIEIDVKAVQSLVDQQQIVLIDCREPDEWETARIEGAVLLPMSRWMEEVGRLQEFAGQRLVVHCHHGTRSLRVTHWLRANGFPDAQNMAGGIDAWSQHIDPAIPRY